MLSPTPEELDIRIPRIDLVGNSFFSLSFGLKTELGKDLIPQQSEIGKKFGKSAGKAVFDDKLSMETRLEIIVRLYDSEKIKSNELKTKIDVLSQQNNSNSNEEVGKLKTQLLEIDKNIKSLEEKLKFYKIPIDRASRQPLALYAYETTFQKLTKITDPEKKTTLHTTASVSGTTARVMITLLDIGAFNKDDGSYDLDKAQILANCIMGFYIKLGHHSYIEIAESYNRLLDYLAIEHPEKLNKFFTMKPDTQNMKYNKRDDIPEKKLPYYVIGDYMSFIHQSYAQRIIDKVNLDSESTFTPT
jgi:hypothetical protein